MTFGFSLGIFKYDVIQKVSVPVSVTLDYNAQLRQVIPKTIIWSGKCYTIQKVGFHHTFREGRTLIHIFSVDSPTLFFRLRLDTDNLQWTLEEISDGEAN